MKFRIFKKEYDLTSRQLFKFIAFVFFVCISAYLSLNMFVQLGHEPTEKLAMIAISIGVEAFKVFLAISLSTAVFAAIYYWKKWMEFSKKNKTLNSKIKKNNPFTLRIFTLSVSSALFLILYLVTAFTSLSASLGYALTTVNRYTEEHQTIDNTDAIAAIQNANARYADTIKSYLEIIASSNITLKGYDVEIAKVQPEGQEWRKNSAINAKGKLQDKINEYNNKIIELRGLMSENDTKITNLKLGQSNTKGGTASKSMFELIGEAIKMPASQVMFVMVAILSVVIELGIITTSPHGGISEIEEKEVKKEEEILTKKLEDKKKKLALKKELHKKETIPEITYPVDFEVQPSPKKKKEIKKEEPIKEVEEPQEINEVEDVVEPEPIRENIVLSNEDFELIVKELDSPTLPTPELIDLMASTKAISNAKTEMKVERKKAEIKKPEEQRKANEEVVNIKRKIPTVSVHADIESVVEELDKVSSKEYNEEKRSGLLNLLNEKQQSPLKNKDKIAKLAEDI